MFASRIEAVDHDFAPEGMERPIGIAAVRATLSSVATGLDARFVDAGTTLTHLIETVDQFLGRLDSMHEALSPDDAGAAIADLRDASRLIGEVPVRSSSREALLSGICHAANQLEKDVLLTQTILKALRILSVNIRIATMDDPSFKYLVDDIVGRLSVGERELTPLSHIIAVLTRAVIRAVEAVRHLASEAQGVVPIVPPQLIESAENLSRYQQHVAKNASSTANLARGVQMKVAAILGALQIGDTTRQRIEHIASGLALLEGAEGDDAARRIVLELLSDQLSDTTENFRSEVTVLAGSLASIGDDAGRLRSFNTGEDDDAGGTAMLKDLHRSIGRVNQLTQQVRATNGQIAQIITTIFSSLEELGERVRVVSNLRADVEQIAINVHLKCHRAASMGNAVAIIAVEVRRYSTQLNEVIQSVASHLETMAKLSEGLRDENEFAAKTDISDILDRSMCAIGNACDQVNLAIGQAQTESNAALGLIKASARGLDDQGQLDEAQRGLAALLVATPSFGHAHDPEADTPANALLGQIARSYTMARERQIHQRYGLTDVAPAVASAAPPAGDDDDDLDGLFL